MEDRDEVLEEGHSSNDEGTGLGLLIVETVAEACGWTLSVVDGGGRFEITGVDTVKTTGRSHGIPAPGTAEPVSQ